MTLEDIESRMATIREMAEKRDFERAHGLEDALHQDVLEYIAEPPLYHDETGAHLSQCIQMAQAALETKSINFGRWTA